MALLLAQLCEASLHNLALKKFKFNLPYLSAAKAKTLANQLQKWHKERVTMPQILEEEKRDMQSIILGLIRSRDFRPFYVSYECWNCTIPEEQLQHDLNSLPATLKMRLAWMNKTPIWEEYTLCINWQIADARKPYPQRNQLWPYPDSNDGVQQLMHQSFIDTSRKFVVTETRISLLVVILALHAYKKENGVYPRSLNQLVPTYLSKVPTDPFSNQQPLRYRLKPVRYITRQWAEFKPQLKSTLSPTGMPWPTTDSITKTAYAHISSRFIAWALTALMTLENPIDLLHKYQALDLS